MRPALLLFGYALALAWWAPALLSRLTAPGVSPRLGLAACLQRPDVGLQRPVRAVERHHPDTAPVEHPVGRRRVQVRARDHEGRRRLPGRKLAGGVDRMGDRDAQAPRALEHPRGLGHGLEHRVDVVQAHVGHD
jgi:hypothetical protein